MESVRGGAGLITDSHFTTEGINPQGIPSPILKGINFEELK